MLDVTPQIIAVEMHLWHTGQVRERFGDCGFARAGMAGEKEYVAGKVVMNGHCAILHSTGSIVNRLLPISLFA
ncbi:hypothetical protein GGE43_005272 [Agrobacterium tumefaciens]|uniref:Uncharacterized protein n=1 Tax=Agrobacterium radiobacter TaxID=362 RepID=A0ABR6JFP8_AGRRD|nr:hypothetical protein [Agrobacterium radiobacter]MBB4283617.1 hypothetical protein [Agrobacterium radiobacter]MBB4321501.1 hypothetical protein [Agrobacterium radiobacter]MBB4325548.1 hypothetical protein [Agrobacterium radiobacter]MBB4338540.1 hypothetical protein [Agrobacterium radiobacter]MBB4458849.1 hypothetical protein [Agrobacterium radiobacter]